MALHGGRKNARRFRRHILFLALLNERVQFTRGLYNSALTLPLLSQRLWF
jgi:hypothetical protein